MLEIRPLREADVPAALQLSTQAGWNQLEADWQRLIRLWPDSCIAGWENDRLVATGTLASYSNRIGWIGMILVDQSRRGHGLGGAIFDRVLEIADAAGITCVGLDATEQGQPVYHKRRFRKLLEINRWVRPAGAMRRALAAPVAEGETITPIDAAMWPRVLRLDESAAGVDRSGLLRCLAGESGAVAAALTGASKVKAAGFLRQGRTASAVGPIVGDPPAADRLLRWLVAQASGDRPIFLDAFADAPVEKCLADLGFTIQRRLTRMLRPVDKAAPLSGPRVIAGAGFELG